MMNIRSTLFGLFIALPLILLSGFAWADSFLSVYEDIPLAPGLAEIAGSGLSFDSPSGRIVEAEAKGPVTGATILKFYGAALPQLGWTLETDTRFRREAEVLRLEISPEGHALVVHFTISPE